MVPGKCVGSADVIWDFLIKVSSNPRMSVEAMVYLLGIEEALQAECARSRAGRNAWSSAGSMRTY